MSQKLTLPEEKTDDRSQIRKLVEDMMAALSRKDVRGIMAHYAPDVIVFDAKPPFQTRGALAWRHTWEACLPFFPETFDVEIRDLVIHVNGNLAISHYLFRFTGPEKDHPAMQTWMRISSGYKKIQGRWKIIHEHGSLPFNPHTAQAVFTLDL